MNAWGCNKLDLNYRNYLVWANSTVLFVIFHHRALKRMLRTLLVIVTFSLIGCDGFSEKSIASICEDSPTFCSDLNADSWCRAEKSIIIRARHNDSVIPKDINKYDLLLGFEDYKKCIDKASKIEHIKFKEKQAGRVEGLLTAERELKRLSRATKGSIDPHLLYYHWSRNNDEKALETFMNYRDTGELETSELQVALASYYTKFDLPKTIKTLHHALELHEKGSEIDTTIFSSLTTIYMKLEEFDKAYIWGTIAVEHDVEDLDIVQVESILLQQGINTEKLQKTAKDYSRAIDKGQFIRPI